MPTVDIDQVTGCNNGSDTYLEEKTIIDQNGNRTVTSIVKPLQTTFEETSSFNEEGDGLEKLEVKVTTTGPAFDTNLATSRNFEIALPTFGSGDNQSRVARTLARGMAAIRRSTQEPNQPVEIDAE